MTRAGTPTVVELMALLAANAAENAALRSERDALEQRVFKLEEELALAQLHRFAPSSEKHMDRVFNEAENAALEADADEGLADCDETDATELPDTGLPEVEKSEGRKRGRKPLPANLPRQRVEYDLADDQKTCPCCSHPLHRMGELVTEQLHIEVKATVLQNARAKYACRNCERTDISTPVIIAPMPAQPLPGSIATASTLAFALVHKYVDGTPLYRLAQAFERAGVPVSRGTLGHWVIGSSEKHLVRIYDALKQRLLSQSVIHGDETTVQVLKEKDREATDESYIWAYRSGQDSLEPVVLLEYQPGRGQVHPQTFLGDYQGILMSDGYQAWRTLKGATHVGCMAHARRRFVNAFKVGKKQSGPPAQALKFFDQLYRIERQVRDEKPDDGETQADCIRRLRQKHSNPVLDALKEEHRQDSPQGRARHQARRCDLLYPKPVAISDPLHQRRQDADRQQFIGTRYQSFCHWKEELAILRHRRRGQGQRRHLQPYADLSRLRRRAIRLVATRLHRIAAASRRRQYRRSTPI
jgi:transposase